MINTLLLLLDVVLLTWIVLCIAREAKPGSQPGLGLLAYRDQPNASKAPEFPVS